MIKIYLSPSTQPHNLYYDKKHNEEQVMNQVTDALVAYLSHFEVEVIRGAKESTTYDRLRQANQLGVDYYLAIHSNAGGGRGCETFYQAGVNATPLTKARSKAYAEKINRDFAAITPSNTATVDRGAKARLQSDGKDWNHELRVCNAPTNLIELEFHDNQAGAQWLIANTVKAGQTLGKSIVDLFDLKPKEQTQPEPETTIPADHYFFIQTGAYKTLKEAEDEARKIVLKTGADVGIKYGSKNALKWIKGVK